MAKPPTARLEGIEVELDGRKIIEDIDLVIEPESCIAIMGQSGIGKSTLLKVLAGILKPSQGTAVLPKRVSMVFDQEGLYPMLSGVTNIQLGIDWSSCPRKERKEKAYRWGKVFNCQSFWNQPVSTLSAGQRKRVALARAMMKDPQLLLLDETFHALDKKLRLQIMETVKSICKQDQIALVLATHDPFEAQFFQARIYQMEPIESNANDEDQDSGQAGSRLHFGQAK